MQQFELGIIGVGYIGGIRAAACADSPQVSALHLAENRPARLAEVKDQLEPATATADYREILANPDVGAVMICSTPEGTHYTFTREALLAGKHVFVEKPLAQTTDEADELIRLAEERNLKLTIGYTQRFNPRFAYIRKCLREGTIGEPVTCLISRQITLKMGKKITNRFKASPAVMEATHDLDFLLWCLLPRKPVRVYSQMAGKLLKQTGESPDHQWILVTMDDGTTITVGAGWILRSGYNNYSQAFIEVVGTEGTVTVDDSHREISLNTDEGTVFPMSAMPGEAVDHVFAGPMINETLHFVDAIARDRPVLVLPREARSVMDVYIAADLSAERGEPVTLPRNA